MTPRYSARFDEAVALAVEAFRTVSRKGSGVPYIAHLLSVTALVAEGGGDEEQLIAAVLHDYLEDIDGASEAEVRTKFGDRVARMVLALSDTTTRPKPPWRERKERHLAKIRTEAAEVKLVSTADKLHNARTLTRDLRLHGPVVYERFRGKQAGTLWYYTEVCVALRVGWSHWLLDALDREVALMVQLTNGAVME